MTDHTDYLTFLRGKIKLAASDGFDVDPSEINPLLKPHQRDIVQWAVQGGNRAIFAAFFTSIGIGLAQLALFKLAPDASGTEIAAYLSGGPIAIVCAMRAHPWMRRRFA